MRSFQEIIENYSNKKVRVKISDTESIFVNFQSEPTEQQIIDKTNLQCAIMKGNGMKVNINTQVEAEDFPVKIELDDIEISNPSITQLIAAGWRYQVPFEIPENNYAINKQWVQDTENPNMAVCTYDLILDEDNEIQWQNNKSTALKMIENTYIDFLTNDWSPALQQYNLIPAEYLITIDNTDEQTNIGLLLQLRGLDKDLYDFMAGEFSRFKSTILELGGVMAKVQQHELD